MLQTDAIELINVMESLVKEKYKEVKNSLDVCKCEKCRGDVLACTLNSLPPKYVVSQKGAAMMKVNTMSQQFDTDILKALVRASALVKSNPKHEK